jgi:hypothetical protein
MAAAGWIAALVLFVWVFLQSVDTGQVLSWLVLAAWLFGFGLWAIRRWWPR